MPPDQLVLWAGLVIGLAFGICGQISGFCLMSGLRGWWVTGDGRKVRAFALALAVAIVGSQMLEAAGLVAFSSSIYVQPSFSLVLTVLGGALFGFGMVMSNGCGARALVLLGNGNLRSFLVLVCLGIAAYIMLSGLLAPVRLALGQWLSVTPPGGGSTIGLLATAGLDPVLGRWLLVGILAAGLAAFCLLDPRFRTDPIAVGSGIVIGLLVPAGWYATGVLGADDFDPAPLVSLTFVAPIGDTLQYAMLSTGTRLSFGVVVVIGIFVGSLLTALMTRRARLEGFTRARSMLRYMGGGALMGTGGAMALGCSIGQGLTGLSTLAVASFLAVVGILGGAALALRGPLRLAPPEP
ncbi:YeeE/YedE family protein [Pelagibacterium montanilacus]|uniref:YeeE/YedE family protein n=1 Tax=Pelagibacterium montanilacus TaxID=2185280 RepID=UPI0013DF9D53|nr:YeeE/YedE family protein [Pelagibacterium montanilacus]